MSRLLTRREASAYLKISTRTLDRYRRRGLLTTIKVLGLVRFREDDVLAFLAKHAAGRA